MDRASARALFASARVARLATVATDGAPHVVPIVFALVGDELFSAVDHKPKRTQRLRRLENIAANARVSVLADHYDEDWERLWWVRADGTARIAEDGDEQARAIDALVARYEQYASRRPEGPAIVVAVARWVGWRAA